jgi:hypothetical protein
MGTGGELAAKGTTNELGGRLAGSVLRLRPGMVAMPGRTLDWRGVFMVTSSFRVPRIAAKPHGCYPFRRSTSVRYRTQSAAQSPPGRCAVIDVQNRRFALCDPPSPGRQRPIVDECHRGQVNRIGLCGTRSCIGWRRARDWGHRRTAASTTHSTGALTAPHCYVALKGKP